MPGTARPVRPRTLREQGADVGGGHMPLDHITVDQGRMAGAQRRRHGMAILDALHVIGRDHLHGEAVIPQMRDPRAAASAIGRAKDPRADRRLTRPCHRRAGGECLPPAPS